ncbi:MAG: S1C family serine protease [Candidatus Dormibacteria bacterium]
MAFSDELRSAVAVAEQAVLPAVVGIGSRPPFGTGLVVADGKVLTNSHNVRPEGRSVQLADGRVAQAESAIRDGSRDLALLTVDTGGMTAVRWAEASPTLGEMVLAAARPAGSGAHLTMGTVSAARGPETGAVGPDAQEWFEHTAPLPRGASGGPVINLAGEVLGVNTTRLGEGFYGALGASPAFRQRLELMINGSVPSEGWLGVALLPPEMAGRLREAVGLSERSGALVREVVSGGPAEQAGVRRGDLLVELGDIKLLSGRDLRLALQGTSPGTILKVVLVRGLEELELNVAVGSAPADQRGPHHHPRRGRSHFRD